ncbi:head-tail adaptor protein [Prevotella sp. KH2C16]|uniref:phage head completion protein n=1 Tax=Prevotella sp. KH2C16 TaxID=1855325 RepID=UPI0008DF24D7|nr:head-tail adaptor protein [Prevotella sp. KH2C16]SFF96528.1 Phage head-tail joining protein [Prevotella sp. KH2C16]
MNSGELREEVVLLRAVSTRNEFGEEEHDYEEVMRLRMKVDALRGAKSEERHEIVQTYEATFYCYYFMRPRIDETFLLRWDGHLYAITSIAGNPRRNELAINVRRVNE